MTQDDHTVYIENAQDECEGKSQELTLKEESFLECLSSIVLRQLHAEPPSDPVTLTHGEGKAA